jgi:mannose/cellobiose epimerase-like protein (N-acyl-D-glucosamine 2-epimerase family)
MKRLTLSSTLMGRVTEVNVDEARFKIQCRSGDEFDISIGKETRCNFIQNLDEINLDRYPAPEDFSWTPEQIVRRYIQLDHFLVLQGFYLQDGDSCCFNARTIHFLQSHDGNFLFESAQWWLTQISRLADTWLGFLFEGKQSYEIDDFRLYQTNLNISGLPEDDKIQECATLSRLIYGLSSAYLLTGCERYLSAARAGVQYQRETFRIMGPDGKHCFWAFGKRKLTYSYQVYMRSLNDDDRETIPLYEQIYALAGLAQYYRITLDWEVLDDIRRTIQTFNQFFLDPDSEYGHNAYGDYFSHIDYVTMSWDSEMLGDNRARKNWNSIGDHIPAYLVNLILAIEPLPIHAYTYEELRIFTNICKKILQTTSRIILEKFPDHDPEIPFVNERFFRDWKPDHHWRWQKDRAVIGHNLKIAWNLTRVANYYYMMTEKCPWIDETEIEECQQFARRLMRLADRLAISMADVGIDQFRSGVFDSVERHPTNGMFVDFPWDNTKDFWQQEQGILAYLILHGCTQEDRSQKQEYLQLARELQAFWNLFFLDQENKGIFFRTTDMGLPISTGTYSKKGGHSISGYHAFELNYLAHIYICTYVTKQPFCLYFKPNANCRQRSINVLPDFVKPKTLEISRVSINGNDRATIDADNFRIELIDEEFKMGSTAEIVVEFQPVK